MSSFSIDTTAVSSVADSINGLFSTASSISNNVAGYDVSNDDGIDFSGALSSIENNVKGLETKISNTAKILGLVSGTHESIQNSIGASGDVGDDVSSGYTGRTSSNSSYSKGIDSYNNSSMSNSSVSDNNTNTVSPYTTLANEATVDNLVTSTLVNSNVTNLSARESLIAELAAPLGIAISTLNEKLDVTLSANNISVVEADDLMVISNNKNVIVVEARTDDIRLNAYLKRLAKVAEEFKLEVKLLILDEIIGTVSTTTLTTNSIDNTTQDVKDEEQLEENKEKTPEEETEEKDSEDKVAKEDEEKKDKESSEPEILNLEEYNKLINLNPIGKNNLLEHPVTMIIKDNVIKIAMNGYLSDITIRSMIKLANI